MNRDKLRTVEDENSGDEDENNRAYYFSEERSSSNNATSNRFNYSRIVGSLYDIREKTNQRKYAFVAFVILIFFICIYIVHFVDSPGSQENFAEVNNSSQISHNLSVNTNISEIVVTQKNFFISENETKITRKNESFNTNMNESLTYTTQVSEITSKSFNVGNNDVTNDRGSDFSHEIAHHQVNNMQVCLYDVTVHSEDAENMNQCYLDNDPIRIKTKIRFVMGQSLFFICLVHAQRCDYLYNVEVDTHTSDHELKDIYFNYIMGLNGHLYEGRHLSCSFDEHFLPEDHTNILTVGIPNCNLLNSEKNVEKEAFINLLHKFLTCSEASGVLAKNYTMEYHIDCKEYLFTEEIFNLYHDKIVFTDNDNLNFDSYLEFRKY